MIDESKPPVIGFWRSLFEPEAGVPPVKEPIHCDAPALRGAEVAAVYCGQRVGGDFYEFLRVGPSRMLFVLLDAAGLRADTREILVSAQRTFRMCAQEFFSAQDLNETTAMIRLCEGMNHTILRGGLRSCPGFIGCYNEDLGTVCYANAGHTPGLLRDKTGITLLEATGLPLGLFSHTTQSASTCHLVPGAALIAVSRGIVEAGFEGEEFGLDRVQESFQKVPALRAREVCVGLLEAAQEFSMKPLTHNDATAVALVRMEG